MPSFKPTEAWEASPHTLAKLEIISRYLFLWFTIRSSNPKLNYIDGFAGPGHYTNALKGSPIIALDVAKQVATSGDGKLRNTEIGFLFVEKNPDFAVNLKETVAAMSLPPNFKWEVQPGSFEEKVGGLLEMFKKQGKLLAPTFAFIDPFGATGLPFAIVAEILKRQGCEVLLNLDSDGISRLVTAQNIEKNQSHLDTLFGDSSWRDELDPKSPKKLPSQVLALYKKKLKKIVPYVFAFAMNSRGGQLNYHLVFATHHPLGLEKMKDAMKAVDQTGAYSFSDDTVGQEMLPFNFNEHATWAERMQQSLSGKWRPYADFRDYALNETPFTNPKSMLRELDGRGVLDVEAKPGRKKGSFPEDKIERIFIHETLL